MGQSERYEFGPFLLDVAERILLRDGRRVPLRSKAIDTLVFLVERAGRIVAKAELMERVWQGTFVEENNLAQCISALRKTLGGAGEGSAYIETVAGRGYRLTGSVRPLAREIEASRPVAPILTLPPTTQYARSGDVNIAYQIIGDAPIDLVFVMGWVSHLDYFWTEPSFARFLNRLGSFSRLILFDKRGTGLSDRVPTTELPTLEQRMDDVRAVMDAAGSDQAALCGISEGAALCALFAATYPERTRALVMFGAYARRQWHPDYPWAPQPEARERLLEEIRHRWGGPVGLDVRAPSMAGDPAFQTWWATYLRMGASPGAALALTAMNWDVDVRHILPTIRVPTLVLHRTGEQLLRVEEARYIAERIPGARLVELPGCDHLPFVGDQDAVLDEIEEFVTGVRHVVEPDIVLATVFASIIDGPDDAGPDSGRWATIRSRFEAQIGREVERFRGRASKPTGGPSVAAFDGPARAIRCACALSELAGRSGLRVRIGLHTGDCELGTELRGGAIEVASRVAACAHPGEVLVTSTVRGLIAGSGIRFGHWGSRVLDERAGGRLFTVERH